MNAAKKFILLLWLVIVASLGNASALTPGALETRVWQESSAPRESRQAEASQPLEQRQANASCGYELAPESLLAAKSGIGATGKIGEDALKALGGKSQVYFRTSLGGRYVDQLVNGIANESKVGYTTLTKDIQLQIAKDVELIQTKQIQGATWNFFKSPVTGLGGPSQPLLNTLQQNGINVIIHP